MMPLIRGFTVVLTQQDEHADDDCDDGAGGESAGAHDRRSAHVAVFPAPPLVAPAAELAVVHVARSVGSALVDRTVYDGYAHLTRVHRHVQRLTPEDIINNNRQGLFTRTYYSHC